MTRHEYALLDVFTDRTFEMGRRSIIAIEVDTRGGAITEVRVGGRVVPVGGGWMEL